MSNIYQFLDEIGSKFDFIEITNKYDKKQKFAILINENSIF